MNKYLDLKDNQNFSEIDKPANIIKNGGLVLFPTETVYGIGANGLNSDAVKNIFIAKGRKQDNPLILHISSIDMLNLIAKDITDMELRLMNAFWPGPFTIILNKTDIVPDVVTGGLDTVGVRMPSNKIALELIKRANTPIAAPSANISGKPSGTNIQDIFDELSDKMDFIIDGGNTEVGVESTVVRVIDNVPVILRPGGVTPEELKKVAGDVKVDKHVLAKLENTEKVLSPGMKYRHYAPNSKCILVYSDDNQKLTSKIQELANENINPLIISSSENISKYNVKNILNSGSSNNSNEIAQNIFRLLRKADSYKPDIVIIEGVKEEGIGLAIMNRLIRACEYNYIKM